MREIMEKTLKAFDELRRKHPGGRDFLLLALTVTNVIAIAIWLLVAMPILLSR